MTSSNISDVNAAYNNAYQCLPENPDYMVRPENPDLLIRPQHISAIDACLSRPDQSK